MQQTFHNDNRTKQPWGLFSSATTTKQFLPDCCSFKQSESNDEIQNPIPTYAEALGDHTAEVMNPMRVFYTLSQNQQLIILHLSYELPWIVQFSFHLEE